MPDVRSATPEDAEAIATINAESWQAAYQRLMPAAYLQALPAPDEAERWRRSLAEQLARGKRTLVAVAEGDASVIGYATVGPDERGPGALLYLMYVAPLWWVGERGAR